MDKIDLIIISIVVSVIAVCFSLNTKWSYFCAGICATCLLTVLVGRIAQSTNHKNGEDQWETFIDNFDKTQPVGTQLADTAV